jgi:hypothetical protein
MNDTRRLPCLHPEAWHETTIYPSQDSSQDIATCMCDSRWRSELEIGFTDYVNAQLVTILNYSAIADLNTL